VSSGLAASPPELQRIVRKCLAKDPDERYQSIKDTAVDLRALVRQVESGAVPSAGKIGPGARSSRLPLWLGGAGMVRLAAPAVGGRGPAPPPPATVSAAEIKIEPLTATGVLTHAALSPDGKYLVYADNPGGRQSLWVRQVGDTTPLEIIPPRPV